MTKKPTFRRFFAYIIDIVIISFIVTAFSSIKYLNPKLDEYNDYSEQYKSYVTEMSQTNPTAIINDKKVEELAYNVSYAGVYTSLISLVVSFLYFCVFQYYTNGKTVGKLLMGIYVVSADEKRLKISQTIIRSSIVDSLLTSALSLIALLFLARAPYMSISRVIEIVDLGLVLACIGMVIYRDDGVGLHDKLAKTRVVLKNKEHNIIKEAIVTEKKKSTKKTKKEEE